jgi:outer membrane usher protein
LGELQTEFLGHRGIVRLDHKTTRNKVAGSDNHFTRASLATSLAWADSKFALTRPINDSFAIISAAGRPEGVNIPINSTEGRAETEITSFGPGVLGNLGSYYHSPVSIDDSVLPMGYQPPNLFYNVQNGYKQGTRIHLAINEIISIQFELLDPMRKPVSLETGELKKVDDNAFSPITFFSSRSGSVLIEGLRPGNYILKFYSGKWLEIPLKIDSEIGHGLLRIPPIVLQPVQSDGAVSEK